MSTEYPKVLGAKWSWPGLQVSLPIPGGRDGKGGLAREGWQGRDGKGGMAREGQEQRLFQVRAGLAITVWAKIAYLYIYDLAIDNPDQDIVI